MAEEHSIIERRFMEFPPFACNRQGEEFGDIAGVVIEANVEYLYDSVCVQSGPAVAKETVDKLCRSLNGCIRNSAYHVTPEMLRNPCNWYSSEFSAYLREFCEKLSGDPEFHFKAGARIVPPSILGMLRTFAVPQIYNRWPSVGSKFASKDSLQFGIEKVTRRSAILWMKYTDKALRQFGPYRNRCIEVICESCRGGIAGALRPIHGMACASAHHVRCTAHGHDRCEWEFSWTLPVHIGVSWLWWLLISSVTLASVHWWVPGLSMPLMLGMSFVPTACVWLAMTSLQRGQTQKLQTHIRELAHTLDQNQQESYEVAKKRQRIEVELQRKITQLTTLNQAGLACSSIVDREQLIKKALSTVVKLLHHDRAMLTFYDQQRQVIHGARLLLVEPDITRFAESIEVPVTDPSILEGRVFLQGEPILIDDIANVLDQMHPLHRKLAGQLGTQSFISVPLKIGDQVVGALTVDRTQPYVLTEDDMKVMITVANQLALAFANLAAYEKVTAQSKQIQRLSHDIGQLLAVIHLNAENILFDSRDPINEKHVDALKAIIRSVKDANVMTDKILRREEEVRPERIQVKSVLNETKQSFLPFLQDKSITLELLPSAEALTVQADRDSLKRILRNLLENAIKFTAPGGTIYVLTEIQRDGYLRFYIIDTGCGIRTDELLKVFDEGFRGDSQIKGSGLGLSIVKELVNLHGGIVGVSSIIGKGSAFHFTLPTPRDHASSCGLFAS